MDTLAPGQFRFREVRQKGKGGLGTVDEIVVIESNQSHSVGTHLARKRLNEKWRKHPNATQRFEREIQALQTMHHSAIISFEGENLPGGERFYVMPLYSQSLRDLLRTQPGGFAWTNVAQFGATIAKAMQYAHNAGYIHRDLKPENILLDQKNNPVISDWGLGYFVHQYSVVLDLTIGGMGTEYYCSMEQWRTGKCAETGDIYSLGVLLAELVRGVNRISIAQGMGIQEDVLVGVNNSAKQFNSLIRQMTRMNPSQRPSSMNDVCAELTQYAQWANAGY